MSEYTKDLLPIDSSTLHELILLYKYREAVKRLTKGITHEYNNIFTGLSGQVAILLQETARGQVSDDRKRLVEELLQRGVAQTDILFEFSRDVEISRNSHSPERLAKKAVDLLNSISRLHRFELRVEPGLPKILCSHRDIVLMLFYLGENAIEAMAEGGVIGLNVCHGPRGGEASGCVRFQMTDGGPGVAEALGESLFKPFISTLRDQKVRGLGLYAVRAIASDHGGFVAIAARSGGGTQVTVDLAVADSIVPQDPGQVIQQAATTPQREPQKHVFLVVDDDEAMRDLLRNLLQRRGHVVFCSETCGDAVEEFEQLSDIISVVLLDVVLSDGTGYDCARRMRAMNKNTIIILMSGQEQDGLEELDERTSFLKKPFTIHNVEQMVRNVELQCESNKQRAGHRR